MSAHRKGRVVCTCVDGFVGGVGTVGCRVHHILDCGCEAADHEVGCDWCREFLCNVHGEIEWYDECDPDELPEDLGETYVCGNCAQYGLENGVIKRKERAA